MASSVDWIWMCRQIFWSLTHLKCYFILSKPFISQISLFSTIRKRRKTCSVSFSSFSLKCPFFSSSGTGFYLRNTLASQLIGLLYSNKLENPGWDLASWLRNILLLKNLKLKYWFRTRSVLIFVFLENFGLIICFWLFSFVAAEPFSLLFVFCFTWNCRLVCSIRLPPIIQVTFSF